jgi:ABC-type multidrug transport system fused ATPase/permease subunit
LTFAPATLDRVKQFEDNFMYRAKLSWLLQSVDLNSRHLAAKALALIIVGAVVLALGPLALREAINALTASAPGFAIASICIYVGATWLGRALQALIVLYFGRLWRTLRSSIMASSYRRVLGLPSRVLQTQTTGELTQVIADGLLGLRSSLNAIMFGILPTAIQAIGIAIILVAIGKLSLLLILVAFGASYGALFHRVIARQKSIQRKAIAGDNRASGLITETIIGHETSKLLDICDRLCERIDLRVAEGQRHWLEFFYTQHKDRQLLISILALAQGALLITTAVGATKGAMTVGDFVLINAYTLQLLAPIERLSFASRDLIQGLTYIERLYELWAEQTEDESDKGTQSISESDRIEVVFDNVWFEHEPGRPILRGVSFRVPPGHKIGIVGPNGSGKSTLWRLLLRLYNPDQGNILVNGIPIGEIELSALRRMTAVVSPDSNLYDGSIPDNIALARPACAPDSEQVTQAIAAVGLGSALSTLNGGHSSTIGERGFRLSAGERQRISIARAIIRHARFLILDEATSSIDAESELLALQEMDTIAKRVDASILIIAHRLALVRECNEIIVMNAGTIVERGSHRSLMERQGQYAEMWHAQELGQHRAPSDVKIRQAQEVGLAGAHQAVKNGTISGSVTDTTATNITSEEQYDKSVRRQNHDISRVGER